MAARHSWLTGNTFTTRVWHSKESSQSVNSKSIKILLLFFHSRRTKIPEASEQRSTNHSDRSGQIRHLQKEDAGTTQNKGPTAEKRLQGLERAHWPITGKALKRAPAWHRKTSEWKAQCSQPPRPESPSSTQGYDHLQKLKRWIDTSKSSCLTTQSNPTVPSAPRFKTELLETCWRSIKAHQTSSNSWAHTASIHQAALSWIEDQRPDWKRRQQHGTGTEPSWLPTPSWTLLQKCSQPSTQRRNASPSFSSHNHISGTMRSPEEEKWNPPLPRKPITSILEPPKDHSKPTREQDSWSRNTDSYEAKESTLEKATSSWATEWSRLWQKRSSGNTSPSLTTPTNSP